jgi:hypothetical protein
VIKAMARLTDEEKIALGRVGWLCMDCSKDTYASEEYYMLWYKVWRSINYKMDGMLCLNCVEKRLGRELTSKDFSKAPINEEQAKICPELALRLNKTVSRTSEALSND